MPHDSTEKTSNFLVLGRKLRLLDQLVSGRVESNFESRETYVLHLSKAMRVAYNKLRNQKQKLGHARTILVSDRRQCVAA